MGNTPNNNFPYPESSDLVKDGAQAIEDLAASIDTKLGVYSTPGMVKLASVAFSGVSSQSLTADTFTSTYDNYRIILSSISGSANTTLQIRLRAAGSDNSTSNYDFMYMGFATNNTTRNSANDGQTSWTTLPSKSTEYGGLVYDIYNPKLAKFTGFTCNYVGGDVNYFSPGVSGGIFKATTSFDSLTLFPASGTITGNVSVYGYNK
jgi:hypothetical protein